VRDEIVPDPLEAGKSKRPSDEALVHA